MKNYGKSSSRTWRCAISITNLITELDCWSYCFYFYKGGIVEAIKTLFSTYQYSKQLDRDYYSNPVIHDYDMYLESMQKNNSLPLNYNDLWSKLELATRQIDQAIYSELSQYIGDNIVTITDIQFIDKGSTCVLVMER